MTEPIPSIDMLFRRRVKADAELALQSVLPSISRGRTGGMFSLLRTDSFVPAFPATEIGTINTGNGDMYGFCCYEKPIRLGLYMDPDDRSTWASALMRHEPSFNRWGGAFYAGECESPIKHIGSFSGFSEDEDEAVTLLTLIRLGMMSTELASYLAGLTKNGFYASDMANGIPVIPTVQMPLAMEAAEYHCPCGTDHKLSVGQEEARGDNIIPVLFPCGTVVNIHLDD